MTRELTAAEVEGFRTRLIDTAMRILATSGADALSLRGIASEMGVSRTTPYRYFTDLEAIILSVREAALRRLTDHCEQAIDPASDPRAQIAAIGRAYVDFARSQTDAFRVLFDLGGSARMSPREADAGLTAAIRRHGEVTKAPIAAAVKAGELKGQVDEIARVLWAHVHGIAALLLAGALPTDIPLDRVMALSTHTTLAGFRD